MFSLDQISIELILLVSSILILLSVAIIRFFDNLGVPTLILFLAIGMLAGSEGIGKIHFDDLELARSVGIVALVIILFSGGLDTNWKIVRPAFLQALSLSTLGVLLTALFVALFSHFVLGFTLMTGLLLGAIISSTDASAVFAVLGSRHVNLKRSLKSSLELESGSNDPMAVFLTAAFITLITVPDSSLLGLAGLFFAQMGVGSLAGLGFGKAMAWLINRFKFAYEGIYPVFSLAFVSFVFSVTTYAGGSGFLAVYLAGVVVGNHNIVHKRSLLRFFDGLAWLSQIVVFLTLGLLVFPSQLVPVIGMGILVSLFLIFLARPLSVFIALAASSVGLQEKTFISWVGLRGAVPVILAIFPLLEGVPQAATLFNLVFFIVLTSALVQGWSIPFVATLLKVDAPPERKRSYPIDFSPTEGLDSELVEFILPYGAAAEGKAVVELDMPPNSLVVLICREERFLVPSGGTVLESLDTILALVSKEEMDKVREIFMRPRDEGPKQLPSP